MLRFQYPSAIAAVATVNSIPDAGLATYPLTYVAYGFINDSLHDKVFMVPVQTNQTTGRGCTPRSCKG